MPDNVYGAVVMTIEAYWEFSQFIWWMQTEHQLAPTLRPSQPTWAVSLPINGYYCPHPPSPFVIITQPESWYIFYHRMEGGRLSRPRHCRNGAQPVPKAVCRSGYCDKHNFLWPLTPRPGMLPLEKNLFRNKCEGLTGCALGVSRCYCPWCSSAQYAEFLMLFLAQSGWICVSDSDFGVYRWKHTVLWTVQDCGAAGQAWCHVGRVTADNDRWTTCLDTCCCTCYISTVKCCSDKILQFLSGGAG